jgi:hypothetical protein
MKNKMLRISILLIVLAFLSCKKDTSVAPNGTTTPSTSLSNFDKNIYISGRSADKPVYWNDGKMYELSNNNNKGSANGIFIDGNDVYISGVEYQDNSSSSSTKYWKNGVPIYLDKDVPEYAYAGNIFVSNSDVYVAGEVWDGKKYRAKYWKNGNSVYLTSDSDTTNSGANRIIAIGNDVYVCGAAKSNKACYWKNGTEYILSASKNRSYARDIQVLGSDVYVVGWEETLNGYEPRYWKNGVSMPLNPTLSTQNSFLIKILIDGNDVFVIGHENNIVTYWKNGIPERVSNKVNTTGLAALKLNSDFYLVGQHKYGSEWSATYWKNGVETALAPANVNSYAGDIAVLK